MYRTANEAMYDKIAVSPLIPYEAPINWKDIQEGDAEKVEAKEICARCFSVIKPYSSAFPMDAGQGGTFLVNENSGLCEACFNILRFHPINYKPVPNVKINYAFGSEVLQTIEVI